MLAAGSDLCFRANSSYTVLVSAYTPSSLRIAFQSLAAVPACQLNVVHLERNKQESFQTADVVLDLISYEWTSLQVRDLLEEDARVINWNSYEVQGAERLSREEPLEAQAAVLQWLNVSRLCVFLKETATDQDRVTRVFQGIEVAFFYVSGEMDEATLSVLVRKQVKSLGYTAFLVLLSPQATRKLFTAFKGKAHSRSQFYFLLSRESADFRFGEVRFEPDLAETGPLFLVEEGCEGVSNEGEYLLCRSQRHLNSSPAYSFSILNVAAGEVLCIGNVTTAGVQASLPSSTVPQFALPIVTFSFNNGTEDPPGVDHGTIEPHDHLGVQLLLAHIQRTRTILPYTQLRVFNLSLGLYTYNETWARERLTAVSKEDLGVAMIPSEYSGVTMHLYTLLAALKSSVPIVGAAVTAPELSSIAMFPLFSRVSMSDAYLSVLYVQMLRLFGWSSIVVLYCDDVWSLGLYSSLLTETQKWGITIRNQASLRQLPVEMQGNYTNYLEVYEEIVNSKVKIVIFILYGDTLFQSLEALYDLGMRQKDLFFLAVETLVTSTFERGDEQLKVKIRELYQGAVQFYPVSKVGSYGELVASEYKDMFEAEMPFLACFHYDAAYLIAATLDFLIATGGNYESAEVFNKATRSARFRGCTGLVTIQEGTNDRYPMMYSILNAQVNSNGTVNIVTVGTYDPSGLVLFNFTSPIIWPDNTTSVPSDTRINSIDCPFDRKDIVTYLPSIFVADLCLVSISFLSASLTLYMWLKWWNFPAQQLINRAQISFEDYLVFLTILIETLQYFSMGPDSPSWVAFLHRLVSYFNTNIDSVISLQKGVFWIVLNMTFAGVAIWGLLLIVLFFQTKCRVPCLCPVLSEIGERLLPILGNMLFLPIISILMSVFECGQTASSGGSVGITDAYLRQDCYQRCWSAPHLYYSLFSVLALGIYIPSAVYMRPAWQHMQSDTNIKTSPTYMMHKTIYQIAIIVLNKTLKAYHLLSHLTTFLFLTVVFCGVTLKWQPYGYSRPNLWHSLCLLGVIWLSLVVLAELVVQRGAAYIWICVFVGGLGLLLVVGIVVQRLKCPSLLYRKKGIHVVALFHFMFSRGNRFLYLFHRGEGRGTPGEEAVQASIHFSTSTKINPFR